MDKIRKYIDKKSKIISFGPNGDIKSLYHGDVKNRIIQPENPQYKFKYFSFQKECATLHTITEKVVEGQPKVWKFNIKSDFKLKLLQFTHHFRPNDMIEQMKKENFDIQYIDELEYFVKDFTYDNEKIAIWVCKHGFDGYVDFHDQNEIVLCGDAYTKLYNNSELLLSYLIAGTFTVNNEYDPALPIQNPVRFLKMNEKLEEYPDSTIEDTDYFSETDPLLINIPEEEVLQSSQFIRGAYIQDPEAHYIWTDFKQPPITDDINGYIISEITKLQHSTIDTLKPTIVKKDCIPYGNYINFRRDRISFKQVRLEDLTPDKVYKLKKYHGDEYNLLLFGIITNVEPEDADLFPHISEDFEQLNIEVKKYIKYMEEHHTRDPHINNIFYFWNYKYQILYIMVNELPDKRDELYEQSYY